MIRTLVKMLAYNKAPMATFALLHPRSTLRLRRIRTELRHSSVPRAAAIGAAVIALPLGIAIGRLTSRIGRHDPDAL
jgi:hypothetical protein